MDSGSESGSEGEDFDFAQVGEEEFEGILAQIESKLDEQDQEHEVLLAQVADYLATLEHGDIDAMETYLAQVEGVEDGEEFDMLAQTSALDEDLS